MPLRVSASVVLVGLAVFGCADQPPISEVDKYSEIAQTVLELRDIERPDFDDPLSATSIPARVRPLLKKLKHQLRDNISASLNDRSQFVIPPEQVRREVLDQLRVLGVEAGAPATPGTSEGQPDEFYYGSIDDIRIERPAGHSDLLVAVTTLGVPCGSDSSLYVFRYTDSQWQLAVTVEANDYDEVSGAQGMLQYAVSPSDAEGNWFVVVADVNPWCSSMWQGLRYKVLRPGESAESPHILLSNHVGVYKGCDEVYKLAARQDGFRVTYVSSQSLDPAILMRVHTEEYAVSGDQITRIAPLALLPQDFLDEWIALSWGEAAQWTSGANLDEVKLWHQKLQKSEERNYLSEFEFVQPCGSEKNSSEWQIGIWIGSDEIPADLPEELFFTVTLRNGAFVVQSISTDRPPGCPGEAYRVNTGGCPKLP